MPQRDREKYNNYMRKYVKSRYYKRRQAAIEKLGGVCVDCSSTEDLEFDHADRITKGFDIAKAFSGFSEVRLQSEIAKCVLRCGDCHRTKSAIERGFKPPGSHGTLGSYRYCKCDLCKKAKSEYSKAYNAKNAEERNRKRREKRKKK